MRQILIDFSYWLMYELIQNDPFDDPEKTVDDYLKWLKQNEEKEEQK